MLRADGCSTGRQFTDGGGGASLAVVEPAPRVLIDRVRAEFIKDLDELPLADANRADDRQVIAIPDLRRLGF